MTPNRAGTDDSEQRITLRDEILPPPEYVLLPDRTK